MKILKYFLLLITLLCISLIVFVLTQSGNFKITKSFELDAPQPIVYQYIQNLDNWSDWIATEKLANGVYAIDLPNIGSYQIKKEYEKLNDSISQDILYDNKLSNIIWRFSSVGQKTKVDFSFEGSIDLRTKILTFFSGSPNKVVGEAMDKNINSLIVFFIKQYKEYDLTTTGISTKTTLRYIYLNGTSDYTEIKPSIEALNAKLTEFCTAHQITVDKTPLLIFDNTPLTQKLSFQYGFKLQDSIFLNEEEQFKTATLEANSYFESTVSGYYSHLPKALKEIRSIVSKSEVFTNNPNGKMIIELNQSSFDNRLPSAWKTTLLIPILQNQQPTTVNDSIRRTYTRTYSATPKEENTTDTPPTTTTTREQEETNG
ncbi:hypothetical protein [Myroides fluvii]|uniref:hypothetical protein n=1 Tax=Myroides fluvii TaxID=2572594 RepID=UPI00131D0FCF|nr:hypothetical protein [Myroides fluvii]